MTGRMLILKLVLLMAVSLHSQDWQKNILRFNITEASKNGIDYSEIHKEERSGVLFYKANNNDDLLMAIYWPKDSTLSWGRVLPNELIVKNEGYEGFRAERSYYEWEFGNTYDENKGIGIIELIKVVKEEGLYYVMKIFTPGAVSIYKGYADTSLNGEKVIIHK